MNEASHPTPHVDDPLIPVLREVLSLFADVLPALKFPDVDGAALAAQARGVEALFRVVQEQEQSLRDARKDLADAQEALLQRAWRAVAYARVYADGDPELSARLDTITFPPRSRTLRASGTPATADPPRKRPRKSAGGADHSLFTGSSDTTDAATVVDTANIVEVKAVNDAA